MSTTIKSRTGGLTLEVQHIDKDGYALINVSNFPKAIIHSSASRYPVADLLNALRAEGVLDGDDELRGRLTDVLADWDANLIQNKTARDRIREALNPTPPYVFPTRLGAVVEGESQQGGVTDRFTHTQPEGRSWVRESSGNPWNEDEIRVSFTNLRTLSEGVEL